MRVPLRPPGHVAASLRLADAERMHAKVTEQYDEIALKARFWVSEVVDARLGEAFSGEERRAAALLLSQLVGDVPDGSDEDSDEASCRLMLAALKLSRGDLARLTLWIEVALSDPRDLIAAAEYHRELQEACEASRVADLAEYLHWVSGGDQPRRPTVVM